MYTALRLFVVFTFLTGIAYPFFILFFAQTFYKNRADGDFVFYKEQKIGARFIAQKFESDKYFWPRPSAIDYQPLPSGGSNLGPTSAKLRKLVREREEKYSKLNAENQNPIPSDLLYASGSGIDPEINIESAYFQIDRIVKARNLDPIEGKKQLNEIIDKLAINRQIGFLGPTRVNVLLLNIALDEYNEDITQ